MCSEETLKVHARSTISCKRLLLYQQLSEWCTCECLHHRHWIQIVLFVRIQQVQVRVLREKWRCKKGGCIDRVDDDANLPQRINTSFSDSRRYQVGLESMQSILWFAWLRLRHLLAIQAVHREEQCLGWLRSCGVSTSQTKRSDGLRFQCIWRVEDPSTLTRFRALSRRRIGS